MIKIHLVIIGDEILDGKTLDTNSKFIINELDKINLKVSRRITISDNETDILNTLEAEFNTADIIITTGGLGPTNDDITLSTIAKYFHLDFDCFDELWHEYLNRPEILSHPLRSRLKCKIPYSAVLLSNISGTAPGIFIEDKGKALISLPGVPKEVRSIAPFLIKYLSEKIEVVEQKYRKIIRTLDIKESEIYEYLKEDIESYESQIQFGFYPSQYGVDLILKYFSDSKNDVEKITDKIRSKYSEKIYTENDKNIFQILFNKLIEKKLTFSSAESCTGGLIGKLITDIPGSSAIYTGGVIVYSNENKERFLSVKKETLNIFGAVSQEVIMEMLIGLRNNFQTSCGIAVSGIAGPEGGTVEKPVGTVFIGTFFGDNFIVKKYHFLGDRDKVREKSAYNAAFQLLKMINGSIENE